MAYPKGLWRPTTSNTKTDNMPTVYVGETKEAALASCLGCSLLETKLCYAWGGSPNVAAFSLRKRAARLPGEYTIEHALENRSVVARYVRDAALGDSGRRDPEAVACEDRTVRALGLGRIAFTHHWREIVEWATDLFVASCPADGDEHARTGRYYEIALEQADEALSLGYRRAAVVLSFDVYATGSPAFRTPNGEAGVVCPAQWTAFTGKLSSTGKGVTCNDCGLCDPQHKGKKVVGFADHSRWGLAQIRGAASRGAAWAVQYAKNHGWKLEKNNKGVTVWNGFRRTKGG